ARVAVNGVVAGVAIDVVEGAAAGDGVVAIVTAQVVGDRRANDSVVAGPGVDHRVVGGCNDAVVTGAERGRPTGDPGRGRGGRANRAAALRGAGRRCRRPPQHVESLQGGRRQ